MSLKKNILANYASQLYVTGIGILILPLYIKYMGAEAYGLVGFFTMLQAWFGLLDMGLTPTIGRETARYHGGSMSALAYRQLFRALSLIFLTVAMIGGSSLFLLADLAAGRWLNIESLDMGTVIIAVQIMAVSVALRWMCGLYRGVVTGSERLVWLSGFNILIATLRFIAVFVSMWQFGFTPLVFFIHQLVVALIEFSGLFWMGRRLLPSKAGLPEKIGWSFKPIKPVLKFALTIAFTSSIWVLVTQTDKLILSGILPLAEYGYFTLAVLVASGIMVISGPISSAIMPRMARLNAEGKHDEMIQVYRNATQLVTVICGSAAITIAFTAEKLLFAWTGDADLAKQAAPILRLYAVGNGFLALAAFPYYLQYALGNLRYHLIGNAVTVCVLIPAIIFAASVYGAIGAGWVWLSLNALFLLFWVGFVHYKLEPGLHIKWISLDIAKIGLPIFLALGCLSFINLPSGSRIVEVSVIAVSSTVALAVAVLASDYAKSFLLRRVKNV